MISAHTRRHALSFLTAALTLAVLMFTALALLPGKAGLSIGMDPLAMAVADDEDDNNEDEDEDDKDDKEDKDEDDVRHRNVATPAQPSAQPVALASPSRMAPFPVVRLRGRLTATGVRVSLLSVRAPAGARVQVSCRGKSCPARVLVRRVRRRSVSFPRLHAALAAGTVLEVVVSRPGQIGKFTRFRIRRSAAPRRLDQCFMPGASRPSACR